MTLRDELEARTAASGHAKVGRTFKQTYDVWGIPDLELVRWKFNEWDYYNPKAALPLMARGLFMLDDRIVLRGYNKFFSVGEVKTTKLEALKEKCVGPFYATLKENGFLVMMAGYKGRLIVTSKNSSGPSSTTNEGRNYSLAARERVLKHLAAAGKSETEFADFLEQNDYTAVGEGCDDCFEEHVLPYGPDAAGVYLNGLNKNTAEFSTAPPDEVMAVAREYGFKPTFFETFDTFDALLEFLREREITGHYKDRAIEGFVVRCRRVSDSTNSVQDFFFKYKFEEPYFMYREWREVTKLLLTGTPEATVERARRSKHAESCLSIIPFARSYFAGNEERVQRFVNEHLGIIEMRNAFLKANNLSEQDLLKLDLKSADTHLVPKILLVTVATLGCGKSTVADTLVSLTRHSWTHRQNDAMRAKKKFPALRDAIFKDFDMHDVVILDRNNPSADERQQIFEEFDATGRALGFGLKYVCLNFLPDGVTSDSAALTRSRIMSRGNNHATVKANDLTYKGVNKILRQFEGRFQPVLTDREPDSAFDLVINLVPGDSFHNVKTVLREMAQKYPELPLPHSNDAEIRVVLEQTMSRTFVEEDPSCRPTKKSTKQAAQVPEASSPVVYYGIHIPSAERDELLAFAAAHVPDFEKYAVVDEFHVTLIHTAAHPFKLAEFAKSYKNTMTQDVIVDELAWDDGAIAFRVRTDNCTNTVPHITVACRDVPPVYSNKMFEAEHHNVPAKFVFEELPVRAYT